jgi:long-chain acyl-CoA synthetase
VLLTHGNLLAAARAVTATETVRPDDEALCWLPMAWIGDALYSTTLGLFVGFTCNCPENPETARRDLREVGPNFLAAPPAAWDGVLADIEDRTTNTTRLKRVAFAVARAAAEPAELRRIAGQPATPAQRLGRLAAERLVFAPLRDRIGLARLRWAHTGGTSLAPDLWRRLRLLGINLKQSYGPAELAGIAAVQPDDPVAPDTLGLPAPGVELRIAADGEVLARGDMVCHGYDAAPEATAAASAGDGWWRTGDAGELDSRGRLIVLDRMTHLGTLADGSRFVPRVIEGRLRHSRLIDDALVFGDAKPFVGAIIAPSRIGIAEWVAREALPGASLAELVALPALRATIREEIRACNAALPPAARVRRFLLLDRPIDVPDVEARLDRARLRRFAVSRHAALIERLFRDPTGVMEVPDANSGALPAHLAVEEVDTVAAPELEPAHA